MKGCIGEEAIKANPFGPEVQKYWDRRYDLFSRFDYGIQVNKSALFSIKPELHAIDIASRFVGNEVIDGFCGVGGVSIALARFGKKVTAIDIDEEALMMAKENSRIYGCESNIEFIHEDFFQYVKSINKGVSMYIDPPWGGPDYYLKKEFRLHDFSPSGAEIIDACLPVARFLAFTVPANFVVDEIKSLGLDFVCRRSRLWGREIFSTLYMDVSCHEEIS